MHPSVPCQICVVSYCQYCLRHRLTLLQRTGYGSTIIVNENTKKRRFIYFMAIIYIIIYIYNHNIYIYIYIYIEREREREREREIYFKNNSFLLVLSIYKTGKVNYPYQFMFLTSQLQNDIHVYIFY